VVLVIEDNDANLRLVQMVLQFQGYQVLAARTAEDGLALAAEQQPAVILMDIQLPGMDGAEALQLLRADPQTRGIPVLAFTALALKHDRERYASAGFDGYITKPVDVDELIAQVKRFSEAGRLQPEQHVGGA